MTYRSKMKIMSYLRDNFINKIVLDIEILLIM